MKSISVLENQSYPIPHRTFVNIKDVLINHNNQLLILKQYINKADQLLYQLFPEKQTTRQKRGIIDGAGTMIKFVTGNLDARDGQRYEDMISKLTHDSESQKNILLEQAQILNNTISTIRDISENQNLLKDNLNRILLNNAEIKQILTASSTYSVINQSIQSLQLFIDIWLELENALTFAQKQQLHLSLIDNNDLIQSLNQITESLNQLQNSNKKGLALPYPADYKNIHLYESIIITKIYQKDNTFTFIFEIPLIKPFSDYQLIELIPFPAYSINNGFQMIIPSYNTLLFNTDFSVPIEIDHCRQTSTERYFCSQNNHFSIPNSKLCETQLLSFHDNQTCQPYVFNLTSNKILQIDTATWLTSSPTNIILDIHCSQATIRKEIIGSNLIHLSPDCSILINHDEILFNMKSSSTKEITLKLPSIGKLHVHESRVINISKIDLSPINTQNLVRNQVKLSDQKEKLQNANSPIANSLNIGSFIIVCLLIIILICVVIYVYCKRNSLRAKLIQLLQKTQNEKIALENIPNSSLLQCKT